MIWVLLALLGVLMTTCAAGNHNFVDKGKYFICLKCGSAMIKKGR